MRSRLQSGHAGLALALVLAAVLRLGWAGVSSFGYDEARVSDLALQMARQQRLAVLGMPSSTGIPNFPAAVWLYALSFAVSINPQVAVWFTALANVLAVAGMWWLARQAWGKWAAFSAAILFACSPYLVFYARGIWGQDWLAPCAVLWAVCAVLAIRRKSHWLLAAHIFLAGWTGQVHPAGFSLALGSLWIIFRFRLWRRWRAIAAGALLALLAAAPTVRYVWCCAEGVRADLARVLAQPAAFSWASVRQLWQLGASSGWEWFWLGAEWQWPPPLATLLRLSQVAQGGLVVAGAVVVGWQMIHGGTAQARGGSGAAPLVSFLLAWAAAAPLLFLWAKTPPYVQYQLTSLPALLLGAAALVGARRERAWQRGWTALVVVVCLLQCGAVARTLSWIADSYVPGGLGTPLRYSQAAAKALRAEGAPIVVETAGEDPAFFGDAAVFHVLLWGYPHRLVDARSALILPAGRAQLLFTFADLPAWDVASYLGVGGKARELPRRQGEPSYWALEVESVHLAGLTAGPNVELANGATFEGWRLQRLDSGRWRLITSWRIQQPLQGRFHQFNHLYVAGRADPAAVHDVYTSSLAWQDGDRLITWAEFDQPEGTALYFQVGMYRWPEVERVPRLDATGDALAPIQLDLRDARLDSAAE